MAYSQREILVTGLKNAYALESHAADVTENQASRLGDYPELQRRVQQHHEETLRQRDRLGECLDQLGESPSSLKESVLRLVGNMQTMFHATADDEVLKGTFASVSLEHYEIAAYKSLIAMAEACNDRAVADVCRQNLREEEAMAEFLDSNIGQVTRAYLAKASAGRESQSGVM
jgi:ferritin-like metal-binding protein YciE